MGEGATVKKLMTALGAAGHMDVRLKVFLLFFVHMGWTPPWTNHTCYEGDQAAREELPGAGAAGEVISMKRLLLS